MKEGMAHGQELQQPSHPPSSFLMSVKGHAKGEILLSLPKLPPDSSGLSCFLDVEMPQHSLRGLDSPALPLCLCNKSTSCVHLAGHGRAIRVRADRSKPQALPHHSKPRLLGRAPSAAGWALRFRATLIGWKGLLETHEGNTELC